MTGGNNEHEQTSSHDENIITCCETATLSCRSAAGLLVRLMCINQRVLILFCFLQYLFVLTDAALIPPENHIKHLSATTWIVSLFIAVTLDVRTLMTEDEHERWEYKHFNVQTYFLMAFPKPYSSGFFISIIYHFEGPVVRFVFRFNAAASQSDGSS